MSGDPKFPCTVLDCWYSPEEFGRPRPHTCGNNPLVPDVEAETKGDQMWPSFAKNPTSTDQPLRAGFIGGVLNDQSLLVSNPPPQKVYAPVPSPAASRVVLEGDSLTEQDYPIEEYELVSRGPHPVYRAVRPEPKDDPKRPVIKVGMETHESMNAISLGIYLSTERYITNEVIAAVDDDVLRALVEETIQYMRRHLLDVLENGRFELERKIR